MVIFHSYVKLPEGNTFRCVQVLYKSWVPQFSESQMIKSHCIPYAMIFQWYTNLHSYKVVPPPVISWFINHRNSIDISTILNHSSWSYLHHSSLGHHRVLAISRWTVSLSFASSQPHLHDLYDSHPKTGHRLAWTTGGRNFPRNLGESVVIYWAINWKITMFHGSLLELDRNAYFTSKKWWLCII